MKLLDLDYIVKITIMVRFEISIKGWDYDLGNDHFQKLLGHLWF
jgi:hypothetical protein